jgi:hypothetical protein
MTSSTPPTPSAHPSNPDAMAPRRDALWVSLIAFSTPPEVEATAAGSPYATHLLDQWRTWVGTSERDGTGDTEDFWEMAARLDAALSAPVTDLYVDVAGRPLRHLCFAADDAVVEVDDTVTVAGEWLLAAELDDDEAESLREQVVDGRLMHYGPLARFSAFEMANLNPADQYPRSQWFNCHAGRDVLLAGYFPLTADENNRLPAEGEKRVEDVMAMFASYGYEEVMVKMVRAKHGMWRVPASVDTSVNRDVLLDRLGWSLIGVEGSPDTMLVQQVVPMRFEYRVFVVDGRPVTGAGCVEEHTPLHADPSTAFSPLVREHRGYTIPGSDAEAEVLAVSEPEQPEAVQSRPDVVERLVAFATEVAADITADGSPWGRAYVIDVALDDEDVPLLIEANGLTNAGLYASDPRLVVRALAG